MRVGIRRTVLPVAPDEVARLDAPVGPPECAAEPRSEEIRRQVTDQAKVTRERVEPAVRKYSAQARERGRKVSGQTQEQFRKTQERVRELV